MPVFDDNEDIRKDFNFTNSVALPNTFITPVGDTYTFSYNFLISQNSLLLIDQDGDGNTDYDILEVGENNTPANQSIEYATFSTFTSVQKDAAQIIMHEKTGYDYSYSVFFNDVANINFPLTRRKMHISLLANLSGPTVTF